LERVRVAVGEEQWHGAAMSLPCRQLAVALDVPDLEAAERLARAVSPAAGYLKVGLELYTRFGPRAVEVARSAGCEVFLDLKLHDIPETVERAVEAAGALGVSLLTVHASGGRSMLAAAARAVERSAPCMRLLAVTVLTSLDEADLVSIGVDRAPAPQALALARLAWEAGVRGFVTSSHEAPLLRAELGAQAYLVTPGIRTQGAARGDQKRIASPSAAIHAGSNLLVVGRLIHADPDPNARATEIASEIEQAVAELGERSAS
jgi:orotidine-5'-phosphate decarboxylase